jgi:eukaryotic-like serine/threonine-protein kinase
VVGEVVDGRYELEELVGSGGMSSVYKARDRLLERHVALKVLHQHYTTDEYVERFRREARAVAQLAHPNIVTVIDRGEDEGRQFIVFELVGGRNLKELLEREGPLPVGRALELAIGVARGLAFAHDHGIVHRDVKPQNVLLNGDGHAKVTDFGIARSLDVAGVTQTGTVLGTSNYIAPEQASGKQVERRTDVYSLGVVLFELLTGRVPFPGETFVTVAMRHVTEPPPSVLELRPECPPRVAGAVARALEKDPADRFPTMDAFAAELEACLAELESESDAETTLVRPAPPVRRRRAAPPARRPRWPLLLVAAGLLLLAAAVAAVVLGRDSGTSSGGGTPPATIGPVTLEAMSTWDPHGDNQEHNEQMGNATDEDPATYWSTEHYQSFTKPGVGLVLEAVRGERIRRIAVTSDTPGFTARIQAGSSSTGPWRAASASKTVGATTTFSVDGRSDRFFEIWITKLPGGVAHVNEVTARGTD